VFEAAAGRLSADEAARLLARMECRHGGELLTLEGGRVTSREIRQLEQHVIDVAVSAARKTIEGAAVGQAERETGLQAAETALGEGKHLDPEQREAFDLLTDGPRWACLTGRAGTGKGPVLHAAAEAYQAAGWRVIACAMDGTTARRIAEQLGGTAPALTVEQLKVRHHAGVIQIDDRTVIFVDEASKLDTGHWGELAGLVERHRACLRAVGHDGQHDAIRLPGLFSEILADDRVPTAELRQIRRHRDPDNPAQVHPWLRDYQIAVDQGRGVDAVAILQEQDALKLHDTRAQAIGSIVDEWDTWRRDCQPTESALIVHGPNSDVDLVNELAQQKRLQAGELGGQTIRAVDRDYFLRPGDVVAVRNGAYAFPAQPGRPRPRRIENGQTAIVESVDPERDALTLLLREPGAEPRLIEVDQARLRAESTVGTRAAAVRLNYALHSFPAQGATVHATATLAGHWSQAKQETYVGDTRAVYRHSVHLAREDLGTDGTDEDRISRYAQRISENRQRRASIRSALDPTLQLAAHLPNQPPIPGHPAPTAPLEPVQAPQTSTATAPATRNTSRETSPSTAPDQRARFQEHPSVALTEPPERLLRALGPVPEERIARERWRREAQHLEALNPHNNGDPQAAATPHIRQPSPHAGPIRPGPPPSRRAGPTISR
jgi:hypothetical protein